MSPKLLNTLLLLLSVVLYYMVIVPVYTGEGSSVLISPEKSIKDLARLDKQYDSTIRGVDSILAKADSVAKSYAFFDESIKRDIQVMVPSSVNEIKLLSELTNIAANGTSSLALEGLGVKDKGGEYTISFTVNTTYKAFKEFITKYEKSMRLFTLQSVSFVPGKEEEDIMKFTVSLSTRYLK